MKREDKIFVLGILIIAIIYIIAFNIFGSLSEILGISEDPLVSLFSSREVAIQNINFAPYKYRLFSQFLVLMDGIILSINLWGLIFSVIFSLAIYFTIKPKGEDLYLILLILSIMILLSCAVSPALYLLVILIKYSNEKRSSLLLIPLALFREITSWLGFIYLFLTNKNRKEAIFSFSIAVLCYGFVRYILIGDVGYNPDFVGFFLPLISFPFILKGPIIFHIIYIVSLTISISYIIYKNMKSKIEKQLTIMNLIPILLFAIVWEPQLWAPVIVMSIAHRKFMK